MRQDARALLDRLGQPGFEYREFSDTRFEDEDENIWPLFEAVERIMKRPRRDPSMGLAEPGAVHSPAGSPLRAGKGLFRRYDPGTESPSPSKPQASVRQLLSRLSEED